MISLRQSLAAIGKKAPLRIPGEVSIPCKSLRDTLITWNMMHFDLLIITPQEFVEAVRPLADHKNSTGIATMLISLEHIYQTYSGRDEAEKVKRCLTLFQPKCSVRYTMLLGDEDKFPVRYTKWTWPPKTDEKDFHTLFVPVDLYYATLFKKDGSFNDWDGNKDGYFGEVTTVTGANLNPDDVHVVPDLAVGRVLASKKEEVDAFVLKVKYYENNAFGSSWAKAALLIAGHFGCTDQEYIAANYLQDFAVHKLYFGEPGCPKTKSLSSAAINARIDQGVGFVSFMGHGGPEGWNLVNESYLVDPNVKSLNNSNMLPVVVSTGCDTGRFAPIPPLMAYIDTEGHPHNGTDGNEVFQSTPPQPACLQVKDFEFDKSIAEQMTMLKDTGAIAYVGSTITANDPAQYLITLFFEAFHKGNKTLGDMWRYAVRENYKKWAPPKSGDTTVTDIYYYLEPWRFQLYGDPSLRIGGIPH